MTIIERVARGIARRHIIQRDGRDDGDPYLAEWIEAGWPDFIPAARDAISAMREPTDAMIKAWEDAEEMNEHPVEYYLNPTRYRAMIDAALAEKPE